MAKFGKTFLGTGESSPFASAPKTKTASEGGHVAPYSFELFHGTGNFRWVNTRDAEKRAPYAQRSLDFMGRITDTQSNKMVRKVKNRWGDEIWPWDREGFQRPKAPPQGAKPQR